jgi:dGTPase
MSDFADFSSVRMDKNNPKWEQAISRETELYQKDGDLRTPFERDEMRIMHSKGYRRLKHKTQVFFAPQNDHVCTRMEHVQLVASVAETIAKFLNLESEDMNTVGGWLLEQLGYLPSTGTVLVKDKILFTAEDVAQRRIQTVRIMK